MLKVIVADDEERICKLICALADYKSMGMEIVATASNGVEALEVINKERPDILITDIRMPGLSGLELIQKVKQVLPDIEIIIVSGYAHFEYAQTAIKYGVGDYLLKPINKSELLVTLEKLKKRIEEKNTSKETQQQLLAKSEKDACKIQNMLIDDLLSGRINVSSTEELNEEYSLDFVPGCVQLICVKVDGNTDEIGEDGTDILMNRVENVLQTGLGGKCNRIIMKRDKTFCYGVLNYKEERKDDVKRLLKDSVNQLMYQKSMYGDVAFTIAAGTASRDVSELSSLMKEINPLIRERIVKGTGRVIDHVSSTSSIRDVNLLEGYLRRIAGALVTQSVEAANEAVDMVIDGLGQLKDVRGNNIFELVAGCGNLFISQLNVEDKTACLTEYLNRLEQCSDKEALFATLRKLQEDYITEIKAAYEEQTNRPIRIAKQYIQNHFAEPITQELVSEVVGLSPAYFSTLFKKEQGEGFAKYLIGIRVEAAKAMLRETNYSIGEICKRVGYSDMKHFNSTFEKIAGVKPSVYRKLYG